MASLGKSSSPSGFDSGGGTPPTPLHDTPKVTARRPLHKGKKFDFESISVEMPSGHIVVREVVRHPGASIIVPVLPDGRLVLTQVYRAACERWLLEFPAGTIDKGEAPEACAARELTEETGYKAATLTSLDWYYTSPGLSDERMHAYVATGLTHMGQKLEEDENVIVEPRTLDEVKGLIASGGLRDAKSLVAFARAQARGLIGRMSGGGA